MHWNLVKKHGRPVYTKDMEKLKSFIESEIIAEAIFPKRTTALDIRLKHKVGSNYLYCFTKTFFAIQD